MELHSLYIKFQELAIEDFFNEYIIDRLTLGKTCRVVLTVYNLPVNHSTYTMKTIKEQL